MALRRRFARTGVLIVAVVAASAAVVAAGDLEDGQRAFDRGDFAQARRDWQPLAEAGVAQAQLDLGALYDLGRGAKHDAATAFAWYMRAARQGLPEAEINVAIMLDAGRGVAHDAAQAALWYARAAVRGNHRAEYNLASLYTTGEGVPRNPNAATALYRAAAEGGLDAAKGRLSALERIRAPAEIAARSLTAAIPLAPEGDVTAATAAELVWSAPEQPGPVLYFVEVVAIDDAGWHDVYTAYSDTPAVLAAFKPDPANYAWRVYTVARNSLHYAASPWTPFRIKPGGSKDMRVPGDAEGRPPPR